MKLEEYIEHLQKILEEEGNLDCWYSSDDEGNYYQPVNYQPETMVYVEMYDYLHDMSDYEEIKEDHGDDCHKVVCVN